MRDRKIDIVRGILIILVVIGHGTPNIEHDIIFLFHMLLFFVLSGILLQRKCLFASFLHKEKDAWFDAQNDQDVQASVKVVAERLEDSGRILVRKSGMEPVIRVMVEAERVETFQNTLTR